VNTPDGAALLRRWSEANHSLGNHSYNHRNYNASTMSVMDFAEEVERGEAVAAGYPMFRRRFRFPFLKEGETVEKRDGARAVLRTRGYTNGHVTIDASDWAYDAKLVARLRQNPTADLTAYRQAYLAHMLDRAHYYDHLSRLILGRSVMHTVLVHHSLLNALFLGDLLGAFVDDGLRLAHVEDAFADPIFASNLDVLPAGESVIWSLAKMTTEYAGTLRYPGEDDVYEKPILDRLDRPEHLMPVPTRAAGPLAD
jgi:peptidoglycan-N-acetylglucosamine deacetylase